MLFPPSSVIIISFLFLISLLLPLPLASIPSSVCRVCVTIRCPASEPAAEAKTHPQLCFVCFVCRLHTPYQHGKGTNALNPVLHRRAHPLACSMAHASLCRASPSGSHSGSTRSSVAKHRRLAACRCRRHVSRTGPYIRAYARACLGRHLSPRHPSAVGWLRLPSVSHY